MINIYQLVNGIFDVVYLCLLVRILISWIPHDRYHPILQVLYQITDPILKPFQNIFPTSVGIDFSPIFAFMFLGILKSIIFRII
ncbi:MAG: YggT family protein [Candidatus Margulisiibacteriota bacterium]